VEGGASTQKSQRPTSFGAPLTSIGGLMSHVHSLSTIALVKMSTGAYIQLP